MFDYFKSLFYTIIEDVLKIWYLQSDYVPIWPQIFNYGCFVVWKLCRDVMTDLIKLNQWERRWLHSNIIALLAFLLVSHASNLAYRHVHNKCFKKACWAMFNTCKLNIVIKFEPYSLSINRLRMLNNRNGKIFRLYPTTVKEPRRRPDHEHGPNFNQWSTSDMMTRCFIRVNN